MKLSMLMQRWGLFAAAVFLLIGLMLANLEAGPVAERGVVLRYTFWSMTAAATFLVWWLSQWLVVSGRDRLTRRLLVASCLLAAALFVPVSLLIDALFGMPEEGGSWLASIVEEWWVSVLPVFASCMIASLPAWLSTHDAVSAPVPSRPWFRLQIRRDRPPYPSRSRIRPRRRLRSPPMRACCRSRRAAVCCVPRPTCSMCTCTAPKA
jgi:hypothetical protein